MPFVAAICPQCAGKLQVPDDRDVVKCMYCGVDVIVRQAVRLVHGNTTNFLELADSARAGGNHGEAINYYNKALENDAKNVNAWFGKGVSSGWSSTLADFRFQEMLIAFESAIKYADPTTQDSLRREAALTINRVAAACYQISREHLIKFIALDDSWTEYLPRCRLIVSALEAAHAYDPTEQTIIENVVELCKDNIEGVAYDDPYANNVRKVAHLSDSYEAELRRLMNAYAEKLKLVNPNYTTPQATRKSAGCFVVTATLGDPNHPHVRLLRAFRDSALLESALGRQLCRLYYFFGPKFAAAIDTSPKLRTLSFYTIVLPLVALANSYFRRNDGPRR